MWRKSLVEWQLRRWPGASVELSTGAKGSAIVAFGRDKCYTFRGTCTVPEGVWATTHYVMICGGNVAGCPSLIIDDVSLVIGDLSPQ